MMGMPTDCATTSLRTVVVVTPFTWLTETVLIVSYTVTLSEYCVAASLKMSAISGPVELANMKPLMPCSQSGLLPTMSPQ